MNTSLDTTGRRPVLRMERGFSHPVERLWRAITEPGALSQWFPADVDIELRAGAPVHFHFREGEGPDLDGQVVEVDPPRLLAFTWGGDLLRFELRPDGGGCVLVFTYEFEDRDGAAKYAAGWHVCLDALDALLAGSPTPVTGEPTERWTRRYEEYRERLG